METKKSTHRVEIVRIESLEKHPNADTLEIAKVWGYICLVRIGDFKVGDLAAYIVPDSVVDTTKPEFSFLGKHKRIKVKKLRGIISQGLLIHAPPGSRLGDDVSDVLGVTRYEPPLESRSGGEVESGPDLLIPSYDIDDWHRYSSLLVPGEEIVITEKIHGASACYVWHQDRMWAKSRNEWKKPDPRSVWWIALASTPEIEMFCKEHPDVAVFGECYGKVASLRYGLTQQIKVRVFDIWDHSRFLDYDEARELGKDLPWVPVLFRGPYDPIEAKKISNGKSTIVGADHCREGCVLKPVKERTCPEIGRVQLKIVSDSYLEE